MRRPPFPLLLRVTFAALTVLALLVSPASRADEISDAIAWYDTLGYPDVSKLPYVRVATGETYYADGPPANQYCHGFLLRQAPGTFTVFICNQPYIYFDRAHIDAAHWPRTTERFAERTVGPPYEHVSFETLDLSKAAAEVRDNFRASMNPEDHAHFLDREVPRVIRANLFTLSRACQLQGLDKIADELMAIAADSHQRQRGKSGQPATLLEMLQEEIGNNILYRAEFTIDDPSLSWPQLLQPFEYFVEHFSAHHRIDDARDAVAILRRMVADETTHQPKPLREMSPAEKATEYVYQLRQLSGCDLENLETERNNETLTPAHRLVGLGLDAVPALIAALDDRSFTHLIVRRSGSSLDDPPRVTRVNAVAHHLLEQIAGRPFPRFDPKGPIPWPDVKKLVLAWWQEEQAKAGKHDNAADPQKTPAPSELKPDAHR